MCRFFKYRKQDRIARVIATRYNMVADYRAARRQGLSPLEALEEYDLIKPEERKLFEN
jgi:hypothetical protein